VPVKLGRVAAVAVAGAAVVGLPVVGAFALEGSPTPGTAEEPVFVERCGTERWGIKTMSDPNAVRVKLHPMRSSVDRLTELKVSGTLGPSRERIEPAELTTYRIRVRLVEARYVARPREDRDIHLVVRSMSSRRTMIVELADPACPGADVSRVHEQIFKARRAYESECGGLPPVRRFLALQGTATIEGVGFFDKNHGQIGRAEQNGIELHPVTSFASRDCRPAA
jgi:hypothetical protein